VTRQQHVRLGRLALAAVCFLGIAAAQEHGEERRDSWQKVPQIFEAMGIRPGSVVADIGAGGGFFTARLSAAVGEAGRVYAVDISTRVLEKLRERVGKERLTNVEVIEGKTDDPKLPPASLDAALIVNAYHEMSEFRAVLARVKAALKPSGRLVIVEPISPSRRDQTRAAQTKSHEIGAEHVQNDARDAGFRVVRLEDPFTTRHSGRDDEWLMVLIPAPKAAPATETPAPAGDRQEPEWKAPALRIGVDEFKALWAKGEVLVLDVRDPEMYRRGHLPGAILAMPDSLEARAAELRAEKRPIVTYCS
jgi:predicted methyltransferase